MYVCVAQIYSHVLMLCHTELPEETIETPLEFVSPLQDVTAMEHGTVTLECELSKHDIKVTWMQNGVELTFGPKYETVDEGTIHKLVIHDVTPEETAEYAVKAEKLVSTAQLTVEGRDLYSSRHGWEAWTLDYSS